MSYFEEFNLWLPCWLHIYISLFLKGGIKIVVYIKENAKRRKMYQTLCTNSEGITKSVFFENKRCHFEELCFCFN